MCVRDYRGNEWGGVLGPTAFSTLSSKIFVKRFVIWTKLKNAGHNMAIVGEPCNADAHAKYLALFINVMHMAAEYVQHHVRFVNVHSSLP